MSAPERVDAVVIGASIRGLVTTYVLSTLGYRAVLIERSPRIGGADGSFTTPGGTRFDFGLHVLDAKRSELATRLFTQVVGGRVHEVTLRRAIVLRGHVMPYAPSRTELPSAIANLLPAGELTDDLGTEPPTRAALAKYYGRAFTDLIFDEVLRSYPSEARHLSFGVDESKLLTNLYPWFFPKAKRAAVAHDESRAFHDKLREGVEQRVLYPMEGGFGGFATGFLAQFDPERIEVLTRAEDLHIDVEPGTHRVRTVQAAGRSFVAPHYFWCGAWSALCGLLEIPCQDAATDRVLVGSFRLNRPARSDYHEVLVGDPSHHINRITFPAKFRESDDALMQIEFAVPRAEPWPADADHWKQSWWQSVERLGFIDSDHRVEEFDFRSFNMHFNAYGAEGEALRDADLTSLHSDSNVRPVVPSMANLNLNRYVGRSVAYVTSVLA